MIRTFLSDTEHHALCRLLERAGVPKATRTEVLIAAEEAASTAAMLELLKQRRVTPIIGLDGALRWYPTDAACAETAERAAAHAILTNERRASIHAGCSAATTETSSSSEGALNSTRVEQPAPCLRDLRAQHPGALVIPPDANCGVRLDGRAPCPVVDPPGTEIWTCLACGRIVGPLGAFAPVIPSDLDAGIYCADDERCILDAGHDGEHVYEIGATL